MKKVVLWVGHTGLRFAASLSVVLGNLGVNVVISYYNAPTVDDATVVVIDSCCLTPNDIADFTARAPGVPYFRCGCDNCSGKDYTWGTDDSRIIGRISNLVAAR